MTFAEMNDTVFRLMRDTSKTKYDTTFVDTWLNDGERIYCNKTEFAVEKDTSIPTENGTQEYSLPVDFGWEDSIFLAGVRLHKTWIERVIAATQASGTPGLYYIRQKAIGMEPTPTGVATITIIYYGIGGAMDDSNDSIIPIEHQMACVFYACYMCALEGHDNRGTEFFENFGILVNDGITENVSKAFAGGWPVVGEDGPQLDSLDHDLSRL